MEFANVFNSASAPATISGLISSLPGIFSLKYRPNITNIQSIIEVRFMKIFKCIKSSISI